MKNKESSRKKGPVIKCEGVEPIKWGGSIFAEEAVEHLLWSNFNLSIGTSS